MKKQTKVDYNDYKAFGEKLIADVLGYAQEDVSALNGTNDKVGAYKLARRGPVRVLERTVPGTSINLIRAETIVNASAAVVMAWMCEPSFLQDLDSAFLEPKLNLKTFDANHEVTYYKYGSTGPIAKRDFVTFEVNSKRAEGFYVTSACTVEFPGKPPVKDLVRAEIWTSGYILKDQADGTCHVTYIVHGSPKGYIPNALVNLAQTRQPYLSMCKIRERYLHNKPVPISDSLSFSPSTENLRQYDERDEKEEEKEADEGNTFTMMFEDLMKHPQIMEKIMNLDIVKKLLREPETFRSAIKKFTGEEEGENKSNALELFDVQQFHDILDLILTEALSLEELNNFLKEILGLDDDEDSSDSSRSLSRRLGSSSEGFFQLQSLEKQKKVVDAVYQDETGQRNSLHFKVFNEAHALNGERENHAFPATSQQINILNNIGITGASNVEQWSASFRLSPSSILEIQKQQEEETTNSNPNFIKSLKAAWNGVIEQQPALRVLLLKQTKKKKQRRASDPQQSNSWWQVIPARIAEPQWTVYDWVDGSKASSDWDSFLEEDKTEEFDAQKCDSLMRFSVFLFPDELRLVWSFHSALLDLFSIAEVGKLVFQLLSSQQSSSEKQLLAKLSHVHPAERGEQLEFWKKYLSDFKAPTPLFLCKPMRNIELKRKKSPWARQGHIEISLKEQTTEALLAQSRKHNVAVNMLVLSAWSFLLSRCSGEKKVLFGLCLKPDETRSNIVGCQQPLLPILVDLEEETHQKEELGPDSQKHKHLIPTLPLWQFLRQLTEKLGAVNAIIGGKECLSLEEIQKQSEVPEEYRLVNSVLVLDDSMDQLARLGKNGGIQFEASNFYLQWNYPLVLQTRTRDSNHISFDLTYDKSYFSETSAHRLAKYFQTLIEGIAASGDSQDAHQLPMLPHDEQHDLIVNIHKNYAPYPKTVRVEQLFEEQVAKTPDRIAIEFEGRLVTYKELNDEVNRMANYFVSKGITGNGCVVALYLVRDISMVVAMLAIVKAGAAYLPLDPRTPRDRVHVIMEDAKARGIVTNQNKAEYLFEGAIPSGFEVLCVDKEQDIDALAQQPSTPVDESIRNALHSEGLMYIIYTSGSTGKPKGVKICHRSLINQFVYIAKLPGMTEADRILGVSTISFDIAQLELMLPVTIGARILLVSADVARDGHTLRSVLESNSSKNCPTHPLTILQATPATWRMLVAAGWEGDKDVLSLWCGGEAMTCDLAKQLLPRCKGLYNMYGPTETTVWGSVLKVSPTEDVSPHSTTIPVGGPVDNSQFFVLDQYRQLVPKGVHGELYIAGDGVGSYVDKELSDRMYVQNPFQSWFGEGKTSERMFRVGDVLRYKYDARKERAKEHLERLRKIDHDSKEELLMEENERVELEFLGRVDHQVKIRGYRIELEEIVNHLYQHESVGECLVVAKQPAYEGGEKYLVAYVILKKKKTEGEKEVEEDSEQLEKEREKEKRSLAHNLRLMLEEKLPPYMVPAHFMVLDKWPLSPNGKIDRNALPVPTRSSHEANQTYAAPTNEIERKLVQVFEEVLQLSPIGIEDDFFELGGNSLLGVSLIGAIEAKFGIRFPFSVIFSASSIRVLATCIEEALKNRDSNAPSSPHEELRDGLACPNDSVPTKHQADQLLSSLDSPVVSLQTKGDRIPIFFIHPAFKSAVCYGALSFYLGDDQPFYGLEPRMEYDSIESMAASYVDAILQVQPQGPYRIGGWSFGATVAYEIARRLEEHGHQVDKLIMLDGRAPLYEDEGQIDLDALVMCILCRGAKQFLGFGMDISYTDILPMTPDKRLLHIVEKVLDQNGLEKISPGVAGSFFFRFQRDIKESEIFVRKYKLESKRKFSGPIHLFRSMNTKPFLGWEDKILETQTLGWEHFTDNQILVTETNSDHESVVFQPAVREVAHKLRKCLDGEM